VSTGPDQDDPVRTVARGGALNLVGSVVYGAANFGFVIVVTQLLGAKASGALLVAIAVLNVAKGVTVLGANSGLVRMVSKERALRRPERLVPMAWAAVIPVAVVGTVLGVTLYLAAEPLAELFDGGRRLAAILRVFAPILPLAGVYTVLVQGSRGFDTMRVQVVIDKIATALALPLGAALVVSLGGGEVAVAGMYAVVTGLGFVAVIVAFVQLVRAEHLRIGAPRERLSPRVVAGELWAFNLPRALGQAFNVAVLWLDTLLLAAWLDSTQAGIYAAGTRYLLIGTFAAEAVMQAVGPRVSGLLTAGRRDDAQRVVTAGTVWQAAIITPVYLFVIAFAAPLLRIFGPEFVAAQTALVCLAVGMLIAGWCGPADSVVLMSGRSRLSLVNSAVALAVNVVANIVLIPGVGMSGAGVAWGLTLLAAYGLPVLQARRSLGITTGSPALFRQAVRAFATVGLASVAVRITLGDDLPAAVLAATVGFGAYALLTWARRRDLGLASSSDHRLPMIPSSAA
jgi:O-antigen/teichoic acid export membrane protein